MQERDEEKFKLLKKYFESSRRKDGIRQLKMRIERAEGIVMSRKTIARLKKKYGLITEIRKQSRYRFVNKTAHEHAVAKNILDRNFNNVNADEVYLTDITELKYKNGKAYFAAVKDLGTKEIVGSAISKRVDLELSNTAMKEALIDLPEIAKKSLIVHSDQGVNYTHYSFRNMLSKEKITQSMSRKGNCLDNAPMESFFGLIKDHLELKSCQTIEDVKKEVTRVVDYYNKERPQLGLKKMTPMEYRRHFFSSAFY